jgi:hypothetical protein
MGIQYLEVSFNRTLIGSSLILQRTTRVHVLDELSSQSNRLGPRTEPKLEPMKRAYCWLFQFYSFRAVPSSPPLSPLQAPSFSGVRLVEIWDEDGVKRVGLSPSLCAKGSPSVHCLSQIITSPQFGFPHTAQCAVYSFEVNQSLPLRSRHGSLSLG